MVRVLLLLSVYLYAVGSLFGQVSEKETGLDIIQINNNDLIHIEGNGRQVDINESSSYIELIKKTNESGVIVLKFCANKSGIVTFVQLNNQETTITDRNLLKLCMKAAHEFEVKLTSGAVKEECRKVMFLLNTPSKSNESEGLFKEPAEQIIQEYLGGSSGRGEYDGSGQGIFGRKVIYRDMSATFKAVNQTGKVVIKACVNQAGIVTSAEIIDSETTIKDKNTLQLFLKPAYKWKVQPDLGAPKEQCGKFIFNIDNSVNRKLKG